MTTHALVQECPHCLKSMELATGVDNDHPPRVGDLSVCIECGSFLQYGERLVLEPVTEELLESLPEKTRQTLADVASAVKLINRLRGRNETH